MTAVPAIAAAPEAEAPPRRFEWDGNTFQTSHARPRTATLHEGLSHSGKRRVMIFGDYQMKCWLANKQYDDATIWHYNEDGTLDGATSEWTLRELGK